ncbi:hypothetical protein [Clostridium sp. FP1]|uniref:hypothetical protein n=1 Tax=Clostridium sp. FP1 TaxID=2724076 RepID=UPI0013E9774E|nr:hypothetical protein [Clostridium sp. FP1]MBZ9633163.1 hypothetical protein [Clostridium sp. FP1]
MSKKDECFEIFYAHSEAKRERAIEIAMSTTGVSKATAFTYYPAWRKEFMSKPYYVALEKDMKAKIKISKDAANKSQKTVLNHSNVDIKTKMDNEITEVANESPIKEVTQEPITTDINIEKIVSDAFAKGKEAFNENKDKIFDEAMERAARRTERLISSVKEIINPKVEGINWKIDVINPVVVDKKKEDILVTNLVPVVMKGKHGSYKFDKDAMEREAHRHVRKSN